MPSNSSKMPQIPSTTKSNNDDFLADFSNALKKPGLSPFSSYAFLHKSERQSSLPANPFKTRKLAHLFSPKWKLSCRPLVYANEFLHLIPPM
jgi:hypothetical protein